MVVWKYSSVEFVIPVQISFDIPIQKFRFRWKSGSGIDILSTLITNQHNGEKI